MTNLMCCISKGGHYMLTTASYCVHVAHVVSNEKMNANDM